MKKTNFLLKTIIILLFSSILIFSSSFKKERTFTKRIHEINLRNLEEKKWQLILSLCCSILHGTSEVVILIELCILCSNQCHCETEDHNKLTFFYFCINGLIMIFTVAYVLLKTTEYLIILSIYLGLFFIFSIIYLVKCCGNSEKYCTGICTGEHLKDLAKLPLPMYCICGEVCCCCEENSCGAFCLGIPFALIFIIGTTIEYYLFLLVYMFFMLLFNIFTCGFCEDCDCNCKNCGNCNNCGNCGNCCNSCNCSCCCECCHCCKCCSKENKNNIPNDNQDDICVTRLRVEAVYYESYIVNESEIKKNDNESNNEIDEVNVYEMDNYNENMI